MVQHLLHIQNLVTPEIWYNIRSFRRLISLLGASGSSFGIFLPPPIRYTEREKSLGVEWMESEHFKDGEAFDPKAAYDGDGVSTIDEAHAETDPFGPGSRLAITNYAHDDNSTCTLTWLSKGKDVTTTILKRICDTLNYRNEVPFRVLERKWGHVGGARSATVAEDTIIHGDNLVALKSLLPRYDKWLCMMYPRLRLLQKLLFDDGTIFISIDDVESAQLRLICDEIFGSNYRTASRATPANSRSRIAIVGTASSGSSVG